jgi:hypothetical protein
MSTAVKGLLIALVMIVISLVINFTGNQDNKAMQYIVWAVYLAGIIWAINQYGKEIHHNSTFGNYFAHGFKTAAMVTLLMIIFTVVLLMVSPEIKEKALDEARKAMAARKGVTDEQMQQAVDLTKRFFYPMVMGATLVMNLIIGAISSLIGAAIVKKDPRPFNENVNA